MDFQLVPATQDNIHGIANCAYLAFVDDGLENAVFPTAIAPPGTNPRVEFRLRRLKTVLASPDWHYVVATVPSQDGSPQIVGFAGWQAPHTVDSKKVDPTPAELAFPGVDVEAAEYATEIVEKAKKDTLGADETNVWYLASLGVDPAFKGKGIASKLVKWGLDLADRDGKAAYLVSSPAARGVYGRLGFQELGKRNILKEPASLLATLMKKEPTK